MATMPRLRERLRPGDLALTALLALACVLALARLPGHPEVLGPLLRHAAILTGFAALLALSAAGRLPWSSAVRVVASLAVMFSLYQSLGQLGLLLHDRSVDAELSAIDVQLLGRNPALWLDGRAGYGLVEAMSFVYLLYIGWVYLSLALECLGREEEDREAFLLGLTLTYAIAYLGYLLLPARGPAGFHAADYAHALPGGPIHAFMKGAVEANGGAIGAFPSLHVGGAVYLCLFSLRRNRMRGLAVRMVRRRGAPPRAVRHAAAGPWPDRWCWATVGTGPPRTREADHAPHDGRRDGDRALCLRHQLRAACARCHGVQGGEAARFPGAHRAVPGEAERRAPPGRRAARAAPPAALQSPGRVSAQASLPRGAGATRRPWQAPRSASPP
jgi:hypothetical protein